MTAPEASDRDNANGRDSAAQGESFGDRLRLLLVSFGGLGLLPLAPGTWGTAGAALVAALALEFWPLAAEHWLEFSLGMIAWSSLVTITLTPAVERASGKDAQIIVTDEVAGYFATVALMTEPTLAHLVAAFFVFRLFDIVKPWPGYLLERLPGGWGVLLDDVMGGIYGAALFLAVERWAG